MEFTLTNDIIHVATDWWGFGATLVAGVLTAIATMAAVIYTRGILSQYNPQPAEQGQTLNRKSDINTTPQ